MGLNKSFEYSNTGLTLSYWKIIEFAGEKNYLNNTSNLTINLCGYKDKDNRDANKSFLNVKSVVIKDFDIRQLPNFVDERTILYALVKQQEEWLDALDC